MFQKITEDWNPDLCGVVFDAPGPTFRHKAYAEYNKYLAALSPLYV